MRFVIRWRSGILVGALASLIATSLPAVASADGSLPTSAEDRVASALEGAFENYSDHTSVLDHVKAFDAPLAASDASALRAALEPEALQQSILTALQAPLTVTADTAQLHDLRLSLDLNTIFASADWLEAADSVRAKVASPDFLAGVAANQAALPIRTPRSYSDFLIQAETSLFPQLVGLGATLIAGIANGICWAYPACRPLGVLVGLVTSASTSGFILYAAYVNQVVTKCGTSTSMTRSGSDVLYGANFACQGGTRWVDLSVYLVQNGQKTYDGFIQPFYNSYYGSASQQVYGSFPGCFQAYSYVTGVNSGGSEFVSQPILSQHACY